MKTNQTLTLNKYYTFSIKHKLTEELSRKELEKELHIRKIGLLNLYFYNFTSHLQKNVLFDNTKFELLVNEDVDNLISILDIYDFTKVTKDNSILKYKNNRCLEVTVISDTSNKIIIFEDYSNLYINDIIISYNNLTKIHSLAIRLNLIKTTNKFPNQKKVTLIDGFIKIENEILSQINNIN